MGELIPIPSASELEQDEPHLIVHQGVPYCVLKKKSGDVCVYVAVCSHKDRAIVPLRIKKGKLVCPHHGVTFDPETGNVADERGKDVPTGLPLVEVIAREDGGAAIRARKRHRKLLSKKERRRLAKRALEQSEARPSQSQLEHSARTPVT